MQVNELILELANEAYSKYQGNNWTYVSTELGKRYGIVKTPNACKKTYQRMNKGVKPRELKEEAITEIKQPTDFAKFGLEGNGTQTSERMIALSESDMKNPLSLMKAHGYNPGEFELISATNNFWGNELYQSKIKVKPLKKDDEELTREDIKEIIKEINPSEIMIEVLRRENKFNVVKRKKALEICFTDLHLGLFSWAKETGENGDYKIIEGKVNELVDDLKQEILNDNNIDTLFINFLGDNLHVDNEEGKTTGGTFVHMDGRAKKMVMVAYRMFINIISSLSIVPYVYVRSVEGNHSRLVEFTILESMPYIFANNPHIKFDVSPMPRKAYLYGKFLIGLMHGDMPKKQAYNWIQIDYKELWGQCKYAEIHAGHWHRELTETDTFAGLTIRYNPTPKPTDHYEYFNGYVGAEKKIACYVWDSEEGLESIKYFRSDFKNE